MQRAKGFFGYI
jgi:hypothetical protein